MNTTAVKSTTVVVDAKNKSGHKAYSLGAKHELAQLAATGCFNNTFYTTAEEQLDRFLKLASEVEPEFVGKVAVYAREEGFMKDMPAALTAYLSTVDPSVVKRIFMRVINNGKMLRNFVQILRSGMIGRKSLGTAPRRQVRAWLESRSDRDLFMSSIGSNPSFGDVIALVHPRPNTKERAAMYGYFRGKEKGKFGDVEFNVAESLPDFLMAYEAFKKDPTGEIPRLPMEMLEGLELSEAVWKEICTRASWQQTRQGLAKFNRHGVFKDPAMVKLVADRLRDETLIRKANCFPYQLFQAYKMTEGELPREITQALIEATELATTNVPAIEGLVRVFPDVSGSMSSSPVTGHRKGATTKVMAIDAAALITAAILRKNPNAEVIPFEGMVKPVQLNARDSIMVNAEKLRRLGGGSTDCSAPLRLLNQRGDLMDVGIFVSDNESNIGNVVEGSGLGFHFGASRAPATLQEFDRLKSRNPNAKLICIDTAPGATVQAPDRGDIMNIGGFSDSVFEVIAAFLAGNSKDHWVDVIEKISL